MPPSETPHWSFLIDEDLPRSIAFTLRAAGYAATDAREAGLRGQADGAVFRHAQDQRQTLIAGDIGFSNTLRFPVGSHAGLIVVHLPKDVSAPHVGQAILNGLGALAGHPLAGTLLVIEPGRLRIHWPPVAERASDA